MIMIGAMYKRKKNILQRLRKRIMNSKTKSTKTTSNTENNKADAEMYLSYLLGSV